MLDDDDDVYEAVFDRVGLHCTIRQSKEGK